MAFEGAEKTRHNWTCKKGAHRGSIRFGNEPHLRKRMLLLPKAYYYWGSRKKATLQARIQDKEWHNPIAVQTVVDKGGVEWRKRTAGELLTEFMKLHEALGKPKKMSYEEFKGKISEILKTKPKGLSWTEIRNRLRLPQKVPNNLWVRMMEKDIGLTRTREGRGIVWKLK